MNSYWRRCCSSVFMHAYTVFPMSAAFGMHTWENATCVVSNLYVLFLDVFQVEEKALRESWVKITQNSH